MSAAEFKRLRKKCGLTQAEWGRMLRYRASKDRDFARIIRRFESGEREIPASIAMLAKMYAKHGVPKQ